MQFMQNIQLSMHSELLNELLRYAEALEILLHAHKLVHQVEQPPGDRVLALHPQDDVLEHQPAQGPVEGLLEDQVHGQVDEEQGDQVRVPDQVYAVVYQPGPELGRADGDYLLG